MKHILYSIFSGVILTAAGFFASCNQNAEFSEFIPTHALQEMVRSATATCDGETVVGTVDNSAHEIKFIFVKTNDFAQVNIDIVYHERTILGNAAPKGPTTIDLNSPYTFTLNNQVEDFTYSVSAIKAATAQIDRTQCSVVADLPGDAVIKPENHVYLFDGKWMSKKAAYSEVGYKYFGWDMATPAPEGHGNSFTFDVGAQVRLSKMLVWPYWPYENNSPAVFEIYAWPLAGSPSGDWTNWVKIGEADDSAKWEITKNAEAGSENDLTQYGTPLEFKYGDVPEARYYRFKMVKNFYEAFGTAMHQYWSGRKYWMAISEIELWRYNIDNE